MAVRGKRELGLPGAAFRVGRRDRARRARQLPDALRRPDPGAGPPDPLGAALDLREGALALELRHGVAPNLVERAEEPRALVGGQRGEQERATLAAGFVDDRVQAPAFQRRAEAAVPPARLALAFDEPALDERLDRAAGLA